MKRLLILLAVILAFALIKGKSPERPTGLTQEQTIEELKKEIKQLRKNIAQVNESIVDSNH